MTIVKRKIEASQTKKYVKYSELKPGATVVVGQYIGSPMVPNYAKDGEVPEHQFQTDEGITALNSAGQLNYLLTKIELGSVVEIIYLGKESITRKNGQKTKANQFEVSILEEEKAS